MDHNDEVMVKMSHIGVINMLELKIGIEASPFDYLDKMTLNELEILRDKLIPKYNEVVEARKFAAEMIYDRPRPTKKDFAEELTDLAKGKMYFVNRDDWQEKYWNNNYRIWLTAQGIEVCVNAECAGDALDLVMDYCVENEWEGLYSTEPVDPEDQYITAGNNGYHFTTHNIKIELVD